MEIIFKSKKQKIVLDENARAVKMLIDGIDVLSERTAFARLAVNEEVELLANSATFCDGVLTLGFENGFYAKVKVECFDEYIKFTLQEVLDKSFWSLTFVNLITDVCDTGLMTSGMGLTLNVRMGEYPGNNQKLSATVYTRRGIEAASFVVIGAKQEEMNGIMRRVVDTIPFGQMPKGPYNGPYATDCKDANRTYAIRVQPLTMDNVNEYMALLSEFGIDQVNFHQSQMYRQGDFLVYNKEAYPNGREDLKRVIDKLHSKGMLASLHSYAFFIDSYGGYKKLGSRYLQPVPHEDLAVHKEYTLSCSLDEEQTELTVCEHFDKEDALFGFTNNCSPVLRIDDELVYITCLKDNKLLVERGAFGTIKAKHNNGANIRQLKSYFTHLMPKPDSALFNEIAYNTAQFYNECDFDAFYIDAIDGAGQFDGPQFAWYYGALFVNEVFKHLKKPCIFNCCYGPQYPGHWYARTLMGAFDTPGRGYRDFVDVHVGFNEKFAEKMGMVSELGWWQLYPYGQPSNWQKRVMYHEDVEYLMSKALATGASLCWLSSFEHYDEVPLLSSYRPIIKQYKALIDADYFSKEQKLELRKPQNEFHLCQKGDEYYFLRMHTDRQRIEDMQEGRNKLVYNNKFEAQTPKIRIEALWSAEAYDSKNAKVIASFNGDESVELNKKYNVVATSTDNMRGLGVWIYGDGKGEVVNIRLHSKKHIAAGNGDHFVKVDFTGWRYYSYYELQNAEMKPSEYPVEPLDYKERFEETIPFYACYDPVVDMNNLESVELLVHPKGDYNIKLRDIVALPQVSLEQKQPTIEIDGERMVFNTTMKSGEYLEFEPANGACVQYEANGTKIRDVSVDGRLVLKSGDNEVVYTAEGDDNFVNRAALTFITLGERI